LHKLAVLLNKLAMLLYKLAMLCCGAPAADPPHSLEIMQTQIHLYPWDDRLLYVGPSIDTSMHRLHSAVWYAAPDGLIRLQLEDGTIIEDQVVFVPSDTLHATLAKDSPVAALFWQPESAAFRHIASRFENEVRHFPCKFEDRESLAILFSGTARLHEAEALMARIFDVPNLRPPQLPATDARIDLALATIRAAPQDYSSIDALAQMVHLSPSRFAHVFKDVVGVPVRRYVLWAKLRRALEFAMKGESLTAAAISAGFSDSAHLSRSFRNLCGIAPEFLFRNRERLVVHD
jgi:AraC family transcriptional regulator